MARPASFLAYETIPHVASRIDRFLNPDKGDTFQVDTATQAFQNGGLFGTGPGGGEAKQILPDAHTDFTFAVVGEEFGFIACIALIVLFAFIVIRILRRAKTESDPFPALAMSGLVDDLRPSGGHQHGRQCLAASGQGHDIAVHLLWRVIADRHGVCHGPGSCLCAFAQRGQCRSGLAAGNGLASAWRFTPCSQSALVVLAAGGTGGHLFPAQALAEDLVRRGYVIHLMTDERVRDYGRAFPALETHLVPSATMSLVQALSAAAAASAALTRAIAMARAILERLKPVALAGFGGYPSFPPVIAAVAARRFRAAFMIRMR